MLSFLPIYFPMHLYFGVFILIFTLSYGSVMPQSSMDAPGFCFSGLALPYPNQYVVYQLGPGETINFDGRLDEKAWTDVAWTQPYMDIEGPSKPTPYFETKAKMRWDENYLYIGGYVQETQAWANQTQNNTIIFLDNDFEVFIDPDGDNAYYKELEMDARNLNWNLLLVKPYLNGGPPVCNYTTPNICLWSDPQAGVPWWDIAPELPSGVYIDGQINNPKVGSRYWSIEIGIPIQQYLRYEPASSYPPYPSKRPYWRLNLSRVEYKVMVHKNQDGSLSYWKNLTYPADNWVWQPTLVNPPDIHLPERWGYIQFADAKVNKTKPIPDPQWPVRDALVQTYYALYFTTYQYYTTNLTALLDFGLPEYVANGTCASIPEIDLWTYNGTAMFKVSAHDVNSPDSLNGFMLNSRFIWFSGQ